MLGNQICVRRGRGGGGALADGREGLTCDPLPFVSSVPFLSLSLSLYCLLGSVYKRAFGITQTQRRRRIHSSRLASSAAASLCVPLSFSLSLFVALCLMFCTTQERSEGGCEGEERREKKTRHHRLTYSLGCGRQNCGRLSVLAVNRKERSCCWPDENKTRDKNSDWFTIRSTASRGLSS